MDVQIFTTGGTIDKVYFDSLSEYSVGDPQITEILRDARVTADFGVETLLRKDSLEMTGEDRASIRRRIEEASCRRILVTHGTDTMIETAQALKGIGEKTIVLVGSLSPARFKNSDAVFNIGFAFAAVQLLPSGVYLAMNGRVFDPARVYKNRDLNRFEPAQE